MSSKRAIVEAVAALYTAAGRNYADVELALYHRALDDVSDDDVRDAVATIIRGIDLGLRAPSPGLVRETVFAIQRRRAMERRALPESTGPVTSTPEEKVARIREAMEVLHRSKKAVIEERA